MKLGPSIRKLFGPYERQISDLYRRMYIDLDDWIGQVHSWTPNAQRVLEVGAGEGVVTERLANAYPNAAIKAIDIVPQIGRQFQGGLERVSFEQVPVEEIAHCEPHSFDLVVICDVLHHIPPDARRTFLRAVKQTMKSGASFAFKDWTPSWHPIHWMCHASDRYLTGDDVLYCTADDVRALLTEVFGIEAIAKESRIRPWANNIAFLIRT